MKKRIYIQNLGSHPVIAFQKEAEEVCKKLFRETKVDIIGTDTVTGLEKIEGKFDLIFISGSSINQYGISFVRQKLNENGKIISFSCDKSYLPWLYENTDYAFSCWSFERLEEKDSVFKTLQTDLPKLLSGEDVQSIGQKNFFNERTAEIREKRKQKYVNIILKGIQICCGIGVLYALYILFK